MRRGLLKYGWAAMAVCTFLVSNPCSHAATAAAAATVPTVAGDYAGTLGPLHLVLHVQRDAAGKMTGMLDSPDQKAIGIPCANFSLSGAQFSFDVPAVHGAYSGTVSANGKVLTGTWTQGAPMPLVFTQTQSQTSPEPAFVPAEKPSRWTGSGRAQSRYPTAARCQPCFISRVTEAERNI